MRIGIVATEISKNPAGLERYLFELISHLVETDTQNTYCIYIKSNAGPIHDLVQGKMNVEVVSVGWGKLWKEIGLLLAPKSEVYVFTGPVGSLLFWPKKSITIVYDFAYKYSEFSFQSFIQNCILDIYTKKSLVSSSVIICISEETKKDLLTFFSISEKRIHVVYPGFNSLSLIPEEKVALPFENFFLFVGTLKERKNVLNVLKGFEYFLSTTPNQDYYLVVAGKYTKDNLYYKTLLQYVERSPILKRRVVFLGHVSDGELRYLYSKAVALAYPSLVEGFGLPVPEAMDCGLPVITSNLSSLSEAAGDGALLVNPHSHEEIGNALGRVIDPNVRAELIKKGHENTKRFSWNKMAHEFIETLNIL